jgi:hypothetical protein
MLQLPWIVGGVIIGMLISTVIVTPTRKVKRVPQPHDGGVYHTDTGCVRFEAIEVPCVAEADSLNLLAASASLTKK